MVEDAIRTLFSEYPDILYGFTKVPDSEYTDRYSSALVFAVPYGGQLTMDSYTEEKFEQGIHAAKSRLEELLVRLEALLKENSVSYWIPPVAQKNEEDLIAPFSFKFAAVNAGLGWIGKNDVVITGKYGPRVRLSAVLMDEVFEYGSPYIKSQCPEDCTACVDVCPCHAIKNHQWTIATMRADMIDYHKCNRMRSAFIEKLGRKSACGLCMAVCPFGQIKNI